MKLKNPYTFFNRFCLRTPLLPLDFYRDLTGEEKIGSEKLRAVWDDDVIREALFLASPELFEALEKWFAGELTDAGKIRKLHTTLLKYLSRMSSRCTPFGLFAGCSVGEFGEITSVKLKPCTENNRQTRFDMNFLVALSQKLSREEHIKKQLLWYPNTSLYKIGKQYRYIEYTYNRYNKREHTIEAVTPTPYLETVLEHARSGSKAKTLASLLAGKTVTPDEAEAYIEELIDSQILVSELEPSVTGEDFLVQLQRGLEKLEGTEAIGGELERFRRFLEEADRRLGNPAGHYINFSASVEKSGMPFELKYLFQTDMYTATAANTLHVQWAYKIKRAMTLLNNISLPPENTSLEQFKNAFTERYETREIPLATALDTETGIGYLRNREAVDSTPFLDDLDLPVRQQTRQNLPWSPVQEILYKKLLETTAAKSHVLTLDERDFEGPEVTWDDLPATLSALVEIVIVDGEEYAVLSHIGGSSAANLLGRFSTGDPEMLEYVQHIADIEKQMHPDKLMAEIIHLPESRTGNVIRRAALREYEIPYLGKSHLPPGRQLPVSDLMISVKRDRLVLRSVKHDKEVLPRLTNAHNYAADAMPVYHFLCDMQRQDMRPGIGFSWGGLQEKHMFLPRVVYKDLILSEARWKIGKEDMAPLTDKDKNSGDLMARVADWKAARRLPRFVRLTESDNTLLIDLEHRDSVAMWLDTVKNRPYFILEEFLFTGACIVKQGEFNYTSQFVISFYNEARLRGERMKNGKMKDSVLRR